MRAEYDSSSKRDFGFLRTVREAELFSDVPVPRGIPPLSVIVDANPVLRTIASKARRDDLDEPTVLEDAISSGLLQGFAPSALLSETDDEHLARFVKPDLPLDRLRAARARLLPHIAVFEPPHVTSAKLAELAHRDPKDAEYAALFEHLRPDAILTRDKVFRRCGYPTIEFLKLDPLRLLRDYAHHLSLEATGNAAIGGGVWLTIEGVRQLIRLLSRAPTWMQVLLAGAAIAAIAHPKSRSAIVRGGKIATEAILPPLREFLMESAAARPLRQQLEAALLELLAAFIDARRGRPVVDHALLALASSDNPVHVRELAHRVRTAGVAMNAPQLEAELRRALPQDARFQEHGDNQWHLSLARVSLARPTS